MSDAEKAQIEHLSLTMAKPTPAKIAHRLNRHPATVNWHMISHGLVERPVRYGKKSFRRRDGIEVNSYTPPQDKRLMELRTRGTSFPVIAATLTAEFGIQRNEHSVRIRCIMLAAAP
jgi:IS30 family transposase